MEKIDAGGDTVYFRRPDGKLLATFSLQPSNGGLVLSYYNVYFGPRLIGTTQGSPGTDASTMTDRLGTANPGYPYGTDIGSALQAFAPDFATYYQDSFSGFEYAMARYYSAGYGRFLSGDPAQKECESAESGELEPVRVSNGDPVNGSDPTGLSCALGLGCSSDGGFDDGSGDGGAGDDGDAG